MDRNRISNNKYSISSFSYKIKTTIDYYFTIPSPGPEVLLKEKASKFFGYTFPIKNEDDLKTNLALLKKKHKNAGHFCYAFQLGIENSYFRVNDDGEPSNSAGLPIYGQIQASKTTNIFIVVVRYFGGTKLGVGGLIQAYKKTAKLAIEGSSIVKRPITRSLLLIFPYSELNTIMRILKKHSLKIVQKQMEEECNFKIEVLRSDLDLIFNLFSKLNKITCKKPA
ncbi:YigZ family protein [Aquimarina sp. ERC-38]|uniref:IMPACT family protein n=1 Tax=Aquimarina sp. ERC-38 TaxID=2949996 RepID=UPI0022458DA5|nr:YigZ family protein [Aquimarina sp. ERC-38]UZO79356.1 YigZ family protein [Aquimarina sp. ERC-38]